MTTSPILEHNNLITGITHAERRDDGSYVPFTEVLDDVATKTRRDRSAIVHASQVHGCSVVQAVPGVEYEADAIITNDPSLVIGVKVADCCGIMLYDPQNKALGAVHSGWRGTAQNIVAAAVLEMEQLYGTSPSDLLAGLSPCASQENYQVGRDVYEHLADWCVPDPQVPDRWRYNNQAAILHQLVEMGIRTENVSIDPSCTIADERFHSYRRDGETAGRGFVFIGMGIASP